MKQFWKPSKMQRLTMRFSDGGAGSGTGAADPAGAAPPAENPPAAVTDPPAHIYTEADLELARQQAVTDFKQRQSQQMDYDQMTPEEKVAYLEAKSASDQLERHAAKLLAEHKLSIDLLPFVTGKDEADTADRVKQLRAAMSKEVQIGVEERFKGNAWQPRGSATNGEGTTTGSLVDAIRGAQAKRN